MAASPRDARSAAVIAFYEGLTAQSLDRLPTIYTEDARFIDPFNDVSGQAAIRRVFDHMFATLTDPRFTVTQALTEGDQCFLVWDFRFRDRRGADETSIAGATHLRFAADGRIAWHRDYWDPARELYETMPVLGSLMRWLRRRLSATP